MSDLFDFKAPKRDYAVMGNPVVHSKSPLIHGMFAEQCGVVLSYEKIQVEIGGFDQAVSDFAAHGGAGLNITVPFKLDAWQLCQRNQNSLAPRATMAEAVNTLQFKDDGSVHGDNTDGAGIVMDLQQNSDCPLNGARILLIGAGGAARGVIAPILDCQPALLTIANRTAQKATLLAEHFARRGYSQVESSSMDRVEEQYDVVINATAASLSDALPEVGHRCIGPDTLAYDMMYGTTPTIFMKWAKDLGAKTAKDGLGMLVEQAAESFYLWHGQRPDTAAVISYIRKA